MTARSPNPVRTLTLAAAALAATLLPTLATAPPAAAEDRPDRDRTACTRATDQPAGTTAKYSITSGGLEREYTLHLPDGYERADDWPLVLAFHGRGSTGTELEGYSSLSELPAVVAYPDGAIGTGSGYRQAWQGAPYEPTGVDDVAFTRELLDSLQDGYCVDPDRSYATGKSNGGGFAALLACRLPDRVAAVAAVAGALYPGTGEGCADAPPVPVLTVHGTGDATIPYAGDPDRELPAIRSWTEQWAVRDGCPAAPRVQRTAADVSTTTWRRCADGTEVQHVAVDGGGHVWPGAEVYSGGGYVTQSVEAHRVAWRFLSRHSLDEGGAR